MALAHLSSGEMAESGDVLLFRQATRVAMYPIGAPQHHQREPATFATLLKETHSASR